MRPFKAVYTIPEFTSAWFALEIQAESEEDARRLAKLMAGRLKADLLYVEEVNGDA